MTLSLITPALPLLAACLMLFAGAPEAAAQGATEGVRTMTQHASGKFDVNLKPAGANDKAGRTETGRMLIDKQYHGPLAATGKGEMLTAVTDTKGSAAYVAIERVTGTLNGKQGSFVIQHAGTMSGGKQRMSIEIVPDSGTDALSGIAGTMNIKIVDRQHYYEIDYTLP